MQIKCNRGPAHGKRYFVQDGTWIFRVQKPVNLTAAYFLHEEFDTIFEVGEYTRSHRTFRDGTVVFEWIGWIE